MGSETVRMSNSVALSSFQRLQPPIDITRAGNFDLVMSTNSLLRTCGQIGLDQAF
jgi:hypothetical protein